MITVSLENKLLMTKTCTLQVLMSTEVTSLWKFLNMK